MFFVAVDKLVLVWINKDYVVNTLTMAIFAVYLWYECIGRTNLTMIEANGKYKETKRIEIICTIANIILSIILVRKFEIAGVVGATVISMMLIRHPMQTSFLYHQLFKENIKKYYLNFIIYTLYMVACCALNMYIVKVFNLYNEYTFINWLIGTIIVSVIDFIIAFIPMYLFDKSFNKAVKRFFNKKVNNK